MTKRINSKEITIHTLKSANNSRTFNRCTAEVWDQIAMISLAIYRWAIFKLLPIVLKECLGIKIAPYKYIMYIGKPFNSNLCLSK